MACTHTTKTKPLKAFEIKDLQGFKYGGVADGTRTHDDQNHNLGLYQLSYSHRRKTKSITRFLINQPPEADFSPTLAASAC